METYTKNTLWFCWGLSAVLLFTFVFLSSNKEIYFIGSPVALFLLLQLHYFARKAIKREDEKLATALKIIFAHYVEALHYLEFFPNVGHRALLTFCSKAVSVDAKELKKMIFQSYADPTSPNWKTDFLREKWARGFHPRYEYVVCGSIDLTTEKLASRVVDALILFPKESKKETIVAKLALELLMKNLDKEDFRADFFKALQVFQKKISTATSSENVRLDPSYLLLFLETFQDEVAKMEKTVV